MDKKTKKNVGLVVTLLICLSIVITLSSFLYVYHQRTVFISSFKVANHVCGQEKTCDLVNSTTGEDGRCIMDVGLEGNCSYIMDCSWMTFRTKMPCNYTPSTITKIKTVYFNKFFDCNSSITNQTTVISND